MLGQPRPAAQRFWRTGPALPGPQLAHLPARVKGRRRTQWRPDRLTELYFLDEPTALAAGQRPCGECRYHDYHRFQRAWSAAHPIHPARAADIDRRLHTDRIDADGPRTHAAALASLPDGTMIEHQNAFWLVRCRLLHPWSFGGYGPGQARSGFPDAVTVRTPRSTVAALRAGYRPDYHPSADLSARSAAVKETR